MNRPMSAHRRCKIDRPIRGDTYDTRPRPHLREPSEEPGVANPQHVRWLCECYALRAGVSDGVEIVVITLCDRLNRYEDLPELIGAKLLLPREAAVLLAEFDGASGMMRWF